MAAAARYVSLVPSLTETLFELGWGSRSWGRRSSACTPARGGRVPRVGGTRTRGSTGSSRCPTLVLVNQEENRLETWSGCARRGSRST